jgi:hypothetical protein
MMAKKRGACFALSLRRSNPLAVDRRGNRPRQQAQFAT